MEHEVNVLIDPGDWIWRRFVPLPMLVWANEHFGEQNVDWDVSQARSTRVDGHIMISLTLCFFHVEDAVLFRMKWG